VVVPPERKGPKDDIRDAWARAEELRTGAIQTRVYKAPQHLAALPNAVRAYGFAVRDVVRAKNRLRSVFLSRGIEVDAGVYEAKGRSKWLAELPRPHRDLTEWLGRQLDGLLPLREGPSHSLDEQRYLTIGSALSGRILVVAHTDRGEAIRLISARPATLSERRFYEQGQ
jgi:hypothetical protein